MMKSMTGTFRDINSNRREAAASRCSFGVFAITAKGAAAKRASLLCETLAEAETKAVEMVKLNPGKSFVAKEVSR